MNEGLDRSEININRTLRNVWFDLKNIEEIGVNRLLSVTNELGGFDEIRIKAMRKPQGEYLRIDNYLRP